MENKLYTKDEVKTFILQGRVMLLAGSPRALEGLPAGKWIAGSTVYFIDKVGLKDEERIFVYDFTNIAKDVFLEVFDENNINKIAFNSFETGFTLVTMPMDTLVLENFSKNSLSYDGIFDYPVAGFVAGVDIEKIGVEKSVVVSGMDGKLLYDKAAVMHVKVSNDYYVHSEILNFDEIEPDSPEIVFPKTSYVQSSCLIDGKQGNIANLFRTLPFERQKLVQNQCGALINRESVSINSLKKEVQFYAPVVAGEKYRLGRKRENYIDGFNKKLNTKNNVLLCLSCIMYYLHGDFEGKKFSYNCIITYGEIAYQLLNKTVVTVEVEKI